MKEIWIFSEIRNSLSLGSNSENYLFGSSKLIR